VHFFHRGTAESELSFWRGVVRQRVAVGRGRGKGELSTYTHHARIHTRHTQPRIHTGEPGQPLTVQGALDHHYSDAMPLLLHCKTHACTHTHHNSEMPALPAGWTRWHAHLASPFSLIQPRPWRPLAVLRLACVSCLCCPHSPHLQPPHTHAYHTHLCTRGKDRLARQLVTNTRSHTYTVAHTLKHGLVPARSLNAPAPAFTTNLPLSVLSLLNSREMCFAHPTAVCVCSTTRTSFRVDLVIRVTTPRLVLIGVSVGGVRKPSVRACLCAAL
jgi:hypothetical protein